MCSRMLYEEVDLGVLLVKRVSKFVSRGYRNMIKEESLPPQKKIKMECLGFSQLVDDDDQQLLVIKNEEDPHPWSSTLDQQDLVVVHIKKEEDELWINQEREQLEVKREDEEKPDVLHLHPIQAEDNRETEPPTISSDPAGLKSEWQPDDQQLLVVQKVEDQHLWSSSLDQQDIELIHIKKEEDELWTNSEGEQRTVKNEDDEKTEVLQLYLMKAEDNRETEPPTIRSAEQVDKETNGDHCEGTDGSHDPNINLQTNTDEDSSETEDSSDDSDYWKKTTSDFESEEEDSDDQDWTETLTTKFGAKSNCGHKTAKQTFSRLEHCKTFPNKRRYQKHVTTHSAEEPSSLFDKKFSPKMQNIDSEMEVTNEDESFDCVDCGKIFRNTFQLKLHMRGHTGQKPFQCGVCDKKFGLQGSLNQHMFFVHEEEKPFACSCCDKRYKIRRDLQAHMTSHSGEKPFCCFDCGATFSRRESINRHVKLHKGESPHACNKCDKIFLQTSHLKRHMLTHRKDHKFSAKVDVFAKPRPFSCNDCGKNFFQKSHLTVHMTVHTRQKPFSCDVCGKNFTRKDTWRRHKMKLHNK